MPSNSTLINRLTRIGLFLAICFVTPDVTSFGFDWVPTEAEIEKYRASWNPFSHRPLLIQAVDIHPQGHFSIRPFIFAQIGDKSYGNRLVLASEAKKERI